MFKRIFLILLLIIVATNSIIFAQEELVFEPLSSGNFAVLHLNDEEIFIINTGSSSSRKEIKSYLDKLDGLHIKGILITNINPKNCGNLSYLLNQTNVDQLYLPSHNTGFCEVPNDFQSQTYYLSKNERIAISSRYFIDHVYNSRDQSSHVAISNGSFVCYWYEGRLNTTNWNKQTQVIFLPDNPSAKLTEEDLEMLNPEVAIINRTGEISPLIEMFQKQWVDIYALRRGVSAHINIMQEEYELYLKKEES